ncbi:MAG: tRNA guanosine(15) transglycosylase TgtA [Nitrososphaeraceae archaeon]
MLFEVKYNDLGGRIGKLSTSHGTIETPSFVPVIHPVKQIVDIEFIKNMGFDIVITNAYITLKHFGNNARKLGIHNIIKFDKTVMTDSGGYQVLEYGDIEVDPEEIAQFEIDIKSDIAVPLDKPTGYGLNYTKAVNYVNETIKNVEITKNIIDENFNSNTNWVGPVQGAEHLDLVSFSAKKFDEMGFELMALGSPVELMEAYEFAKLSEIIHTLKMNVPTKPIHLFGAGHPLTIPLAIALGCDTFDSASYILYSKANRYMHSNGTFRLDEINYFVCPCSICNKFKPKELSQMDNNTRIIELSKHNLYVLKSEVNTVKQMIMDGKLWEYLMSKAHNHPKLMEAVKQLKNFDNLRYETPIYKEKALFFSMAYDQYRPEAIKFRNMIMRYRSSKNRLILFPDSSIHPFYSSKAFIQLRKRFQDHEICTYNPYLGIIPAEVSDIFPAAHNLISKLEHDVNAFSDYPTFIESLKNFMLFNKFKQIIIIADIFMQKVISENKNKKNNIFKQKKKIINYTEDIIANIDEIIDV